MSGAAARVTMFKRANRPDDVLGVLPVVDVLGSIRDGKYAKAIAALRAEPDAGKRKAIKLGRLPAITFSGTFERRSNDAFDVHSGFVCLDFDDVEDPAEMRDRLTDESRHIRAAFVSPSGTGVKVLVPVLVVDADTGEERLPLSDAEHKQVWSAVAARFPLASLDSGCKDVSRLCYVSHDPELAENEDAAPVSHVLRSPERERQSTHNPTPNDYRPSGVTRDDPWAPPTVREMLRSVPMDRPPYDEWVKLIAATLDAVDGDRTTAAALLRERWPEESEGEYEAKLRAPLGKVTRGTLFMYADQGGFRFDGGRGADARSSGAAAVRPESPPLSAYEREDDPPVPRDRAERPKSKKQAKSASLADLGFVCLDDVVSEAVDWLWTDWVPRGMLTLCDGRPDAGKTTLLCDLAARVTKGQAMPTEEFVPAGREPGSVLFVTSENAFAQVLRPRLEAAGADMKRCHGWQATPDKDGLPDCPRFPRDADVLGRAASELGASLIIVDPLFSHMDAGLNPNRETDVRRALVPLARIAEESGAAVVAVRHFNKSANGDAINAGGGSIGIIGTARAQLIVGKPPDEPDESPCRVLAVGKMNIAPKPTSRAFSITSAESDGVATSRVVWGGSSTSTAADLTRSRGFDGAPSAPARDEVAEWLEENLRGRERLARDMWQEAGDLGYAEATVKRAKRKLGVDAVRKGFGNDGGWYWLLPSKEITDSLVPDTVIPFESGDPLWENSTSDAPKGDQGGDPLWEGDSTKEDHVLAKGDKGDQGIRYRENGDAATASGDGLPTDSVFIPVDEDDDGSDFFNLD